MRLICITLLFLVHGGVACSVAAETAYAPLPVDCTARQIEPDKALPLVTVGRLPAGGKSPLNRFALDAAYYGSFLDNQIGKQDLADSNAAAFAAGKLKLLPVIEDADVAVALAIPNLPQTSVSAGPLIKSDGNMLSLTIDLWQADESVDRSKTFNAQRVQMLYLPPMPAGKYQFQIQWRVMTPKPAARGSGYAWSDYKVAEISFEVEPANRDRFHAATEAPSMAFDALQPESMPPALKTVATQAPWLMTARRFIDIGDAKEGLRIGTCDPFKFLRGDPGQMQVASALPKLDSPTHDKATYAMIIAPAMNSGEWASVESVNWDGNVATIDCRQWTDNAGRTKNIRSYPLLLVPLIPPSYRAASPQITPPGHYKVNLIWHKLVAQEQGNWYVEESKRSNEVEFDVK